MNEMLNRLGMNAKAAETEMRNLSTNKKNEVLLAVADKLVEDAQTLLSANRLDVETGKRNHMPEGLIDRLLLTESRIEGMAEGLRQVAALDDPVGEVTGMKKRPNGLLIGQKRVPLGVIGIIYEARPNVTADAFALCFKTGNVVILKGGSDAIHSNEAIVNCIRETLNEQGVTEDAIQLISDTSRETAAEFMKMNQYVDVLIPRGGRGLIKAVVEQSTIPVIETGTGNCHIYVDETADLEMAADIIMNAKTQRVGVCNACESVLVHKDVKDALLPVLAKRLQEKHVEIRADEAAYALIPGAVHATEEDWGKEYLDYILSIKVVSSVEEAIAHINRYNTKHSEAIITNDYVHAQKFLDEVDAAAVYDYWITLEQSAKNLKNAQLYGVEIDKEGHSFKFTRETGVNNYIEFVYNYILMDGTIVQGDKDAPHFFAYQREEMANAHEITLERLYTPMDAKLIVENDKDPNYNPELRPTTGSWSANEKQVFALNTKAYSLDKIINEMSAIEKAVWKSAVEAGRIDFELIGGEGENNEYWDNWTKGYNVRYAIVDNTITFQFVVSEGYQYNFTLKNAYQLTLTVKDEDTNTPVASIILPFEFTQPTLDITRVNGEKAIWNDKKNVLSIYGDLVKEDDVEIMSVPFYEAFTTAYAKQYTVFGSTAQYYTLSHNENVDNWFTYSGYEVLGQDYATRLQNIPLTNIVYSSLAKEWNTRTLVGNVTTGEANLPIVANYRFYGVYPATKEQVSDFTLRFASLLGDAKKVEAKKEFTSNNVTREVVLTDADFTLVDALDDTFYLFDGVKADGNVDKRSDMNLRQGFEEGTEGFATNFTLANANASAYYYKNGNKFAIPVSVGTVNTNAKFVTNANTKTRAWEPGTISATNVIVTDLGANEAVKSEGYAAVPGGIMIQLPSSIGATEPVTIEFKLKDVFGVTKTLKVVVKAAK